MLLAGGAVAFASQGLKGQDPATANVGAPPPPPLTLLPAAAAITRADKIDLTAIAPANLRHDQQYEVRIFVNETPVARMDLPADDQFAINNIPLDEGANSIRVTLVGQGGESAPSTTVAVTRDDEAPKIKIIQPTERVYTETATLVGTTEPGADIQITDGAGREVESSIDGNGRFSADLDLHVGTNNLTLRSTDAAGNKSTENVAVIRGSSSASIELTVAPTQLYSSELPATVELSVTVRDELGRPVADGTPVTFGISPPASETTTYSAVTNNGRAHFNGLRIEPADAAGPWLATAVVTLPSGIELRDDASFSLQEGAPKSPGQR